MYFDRVLTKVKWVIQLEADLLPDCSRPKRVDTFRSPQSIRRANLMVVIEIFAQVQRIFFIHKFPPCLMLLGLDIHFIARLS